MSDAIAGSTVEFAVVVRKRRHILNILGVEDCTLLSIAPPGNEKRASQTRNRAKVTANVLRQRRT